MPKEKQSKRDKSSLRGGPRPGGRWLDGEQAAPAGRCTVPGVTDCFRFTAGVDVIIFGSNINTEIRAAPGPFYI